LTPRLNPRGRKEIAVTDSPHRTTARAPRARRLPAILAAAALLGGGALVASIPQAGLERAIAAQRELVAERPGDAAVREDLGSLLSLAGDLAGAEAAYREAIALAPSSANAHFQLGGVLEKIGEERKALAEYRKAIELDPNHAWAHYEAGTIYDRRGLDSFAKRSYARAFGLDPTLAEPSVNPHVLENRLATSAMILAYRDYVPEVGAPRIFHEPARIAGLILEKPKTGDRLAEEDAAKPRGEAAGGFARVTGAERAAEAAAAAEPEVIEEPSKTLTSNDLDPGSQAGQVVGGTAAGSTRGGRSSEESAAARAKAREAARQANRPARTAPGGMIYPQNPGFPPQPANPGGGVGGGGFVPGPDSSGRIEIRLDSRAG
jgi:tetratricopeptide (TPR) repeat protein